jgi:histidinol dehydrogenase
MRIWNWPAEMKEVRAFFDQAGRPPEVVGKAVDQILEQVRTGGDRAVSELTARFDRAQVAPGDFEVPVERLRAAWEATPAALRRALKTARRRIEAFHKTQRLKGWTIREPGFGRIEQRVLPLERVAVYAPGGKAAYPSTVLMDVVPARVAGVGEIVLVTPPGPDGWPDSRTLAAAYIAGVDKVLRIGGAQAVAALAYGTESIRRVDKVVGPGNIYVATAKQRLYGVIDIDSIAGPSEVLILADGGADLRLVAADMLAQAEHDEAASAGCVLIGGGRRRADALTAEVMRQLERLERRAIAEASIRDNGYILLAKTAAQAVEIANLKAPEHLEIQTADARALAGQVRNAGAIFVGPWTPEAVGDYVAGPNHTLPTGGTARFFSPLSVWAFYKTSHTIEATRAGLEALTDTIVTLAEAEGLGAHAETARIRRAVR